MSRRSTARLSELATRRVPFVHATVVRAQQPTSAKPGDDAIVLADGTVEGFVGGICAETSVRTAAMTALRDGESVLLRVLPEDDGAPFPETPGAQVVVNPCLSGGALEIFLEPMLPPPLIAIAGTTPVAQALTSIAGILGYTVAVAAPGAELGIEGSPPDAVVVASHGRDEEATLRAALDAGVGYVALVASRKRGDAVLAELGLDPAQRGRVRTPAGLDIGARTAPEVAVSILAEMIGSLQQRRSREFVAETPRTALDPVCGMQVTVVAGTPHLVVDGEDVWFCNPHCRDTYAAAHSG